MWGWSMELCHFISDSQAKEVIRSMNQLRKLNALCDVELVVDYERFPAHRVLLASCSDYFRAMFTNTVSNLFVCMHLTELDETPEF